MDDKQAMDVLRALGDETMTRINKAKRTRKLDTDGRFKLAEHYRRQYYAIDRAIGALQYRILGGEASKDRKETTG